MSASTKLIKDKIANKKVLDRKELRDRKIVQLYLNDHPGDATVLNYFHLRQYLLDQICQNWIWEPTAYGFESRTDFEYDEEEKDITFTVHRINLKNGEYVTNDTEIANKRLNDSAEELDALAKLDEFIDRYYEQYKSTIDRSLELVDKNNRRKKSNNLTEAIYRELKHTRDFLAYFGEIGKRMLIKWLNRLNDAKTDIELLTYEFAEDIENTKAYFDTHKDKRYTELRRRGIKFEDCLFEVLKRYSPRGEYFEEYYKQSFGTKKNGKGLV